MASSQVLLYLLVLAMAVGYSSKLVAGALNSPPSSSQSHHPLPPCAAWCVCKGGSDQVLQTALDYACGHGADCNPIKTNGVCYNPGNIKAHCSYAVNSYYQKMSRSGATCDFGGAASLTTTDPSSSGCSYPAGASTAGSSSTTTPVTNVPSTGTTPVSTTPISGTSPSTTTTSPYSTTPSSSTGVLGGAGSGLAPTGMGMNDESSSSVNMIRCGNTAFTLFSVFLGLLLHL